MSKIFCIQDRVNEAELATAALWSTLEAVAVAMNAEHAACETYSDAVRGAATAAFQIREELQEIRKCLNKEEQLERSQR